ncbi:MULTISPECIES: hypothetical protein [Streptomyces]|uniref:LysR family transcriptional regulator n=1 Tax=Streptomyces sp. 900129855 TaxID=3155129 RepID=A0ABV2ZJ28_9ACTN
MKLHAEAVERSPLDARKRPRIITPRHIATSGSVSLRRTADFFADMLDLAPTQLGHSR